LPPLQQVEEGSGDLIGRLVRDPVAGAVDHTEVEVRLDRPQHPPVIPEMRAPKRVTFSPDAGDARLDCGQRPQQGVGLRDGPGLEACAPKILDLQEYRQVVGPVRVRDHQDS